MSSITTKIPSRYLIRLLTRRRFSRSLSAATETRTQELERISYELLALTRLELNDYNVLLRHKLGLNRYGPAVAGPASAGSSAEGSGAAQAEAKAAEKTAFNVKLEKFEASAKIKVIKEVRSFTDLGLKEAKDLVGETPCVVKKGVSKEEAEGIVQKLKELGATAVLE